MPSEIRAIHRAAAGNNYNKPYIIIMIWKNNLELTELIKIGSIKPLHRSNFSIIVIDNNDSYPIKQLLLNLDFVVTQFKDIENIKQLQPFDIIICDIREVGRAFDSKYGGAYIVKEISLNYPLKYIIICSGSTFKVDFNEYFQIADKSIKKGADLSEWSIILDKAIAELSSPIKIWERTRKYLLTCNISHKIINNIEQEYIRSYLKGDSKYLSRSIRKNQSLLSNEYVLLSLNTLLNLTTSLISSAL